MYLRISVSWLADDHLWHQLPETSDEVNHVGAGFFPVQLIGKLLLNA